MTSSTFLGISSPRKARASGVGRLKGVTTRFTWSELARQVWEAFGIARQRDEHKVMNQFTNELFFGGWD